MYLDVFPKTRKLSSGVVLSWVPLIRTNMHTSEKPIVPLLSVSNMLMSNFTVSRSNAVLAVSAQHIVYLYIRAYESNLH
jgi:hypothetical protein